MSLGILSMDLPTTCIGAFVSVIVLIISYLVYKIGIGEKSFEEVLEEQKKRSLEEEKQQKLKHEKLKKEKKFKKTWGKKSKEKPESDVSIEVTPVSENLIDTDIEIIEPKDVKPVKQNKKSKANSIAYSETSEKAKKQETVPAPEKLKAELIHGQEKIKKVESPVIQEKNKKVESAQVQAKNKKSESAPVQEKVKVAESVAAKKSENAVVQEKSKKQDESSTLDKKVQEKKKTDVDKVKVEVKDSVQTTNAVMQKAAPLSNTTAQKKKKKENSVEKDTVAVTVTTSKLLKLIKESDLEAEEIQNFIDVLLNKQKDATGWSKANDSSANKKNIQIKETGESIKTESSKIKEDNLILKSKLSALEKSSEEKISRQQQDIQSLTLKVKQVQEQLLAEQAKSSQVGKGNEAALQASVKALEEEKAKLLHKITSLETESRSGVSKTEFESLKKTREDLQKVHALLVGQHTQLLSKHKKELSDWEAQLNGTKSNAEKLSAENKALSAEVKSLKERKPVVDLVATNALEDELKAQEERIDELESQVKQLSKASTEVIQLQAQLKELKLENETLTEQLITTKERETGDGQEIIHQNGELNAKPQDIQKYDEKDKLLEEKEALLAQLNDDLNKQKAKISVLNEEIDSQKQKNDELRQKNWKAMEALANAEKSSEQKFKELQTEADQRVLAVQKQLDSTAHDSEELKKAHNEAAQRLTDYNSEVEKNKLLTSKIDKLSESNSSSQQRIAEVERIVEELRSNFTNCQSRTKECLQRICPSVSIDSSLPYEMWLSEFEQQASSIVQSVVSQSTNSQENLEELLEEKNKEILAKQKHYEQVLAETESTLHNLQQSAESQDRIYHERLQAKEQELQKLQTERDALAAEKEAMQSTFQQISQLEELQEKLKLLQSTLETAESERSLIEQKYDEVNENCLNLQNQLESKEKELTELQKQSSCLERLNKEVEELKIKLEKEKDISKGFSSQMVKLNSLVKIGQDALSAEQEMVKSLKTQLEASTKISTSNGTAGPTKESPVVNNESQTKAKSSEKSKKKTDASVKK